MRAGMCRSSTLSVAEEDRLIAGLREGREDAYEELIERFQTPVYNLICRLLDDPDEASDVVQEVFLKSFPERAFVPERELSENVDLPDRSQ